METQEIRIEPIRLEWGEWAPWEQVLRLVRAGGVRVPDQPGVYEARLVRAKQRLTIGKAANMRRGQGHLDGGTLG